MLLFSCPVMSDSLQPYGLQHARPPCPSPSPGVCPGLCSLHEWCHPDISSCDVLFSFCPQSFPALGTFQMCHLFTSDDQNTGASVSASVLPVDNQGCSPLRSTGLISLQSKGLSGVFSSTTVQRHQFFGVLPSLWSSSHNRTWPLGKTIALTTQTFVSRVMSQLFSTLSRFVVAFLPRSKSSSDFMAAATVCSDFWSPRKKISHYFHISPFYLPWSNGARCHDLSFFNV